jgi:glycosyltransferase involved in cell wall biosynthesis
MKICVIGTRGFPNVQGGIETHCNELYKRLSNIYNHKIIVFRKKPYIKNDVRIINIKFIDIWVPKNKLLETFIHSFLATIYSLFLKPDIIHYHNTGPAIFSPIPKLFKIKILFTYHNISYTQRKWNFIAKKFLMFSEKVALSSASQIIFISPQIKNHSLSVIKELSESTIIPNGVNIPEKSHSLSYLKSIDLEPNKYFLAVGRFLEEKGFVYMIESLLSMDLNEYKLVIAGDSITKFIRRKLSKWSEKLRCFNWFYKR